jgi:hypothetical protein
MADESAKPSTALPPRAKAQRHSPWRAWFRGTASRPTWIIQDRRGRLIATLEPTKNRAENYRNATLIAAAKLMQKGLQRAAEEFGTESCLHDTSEDDYSAGIRDDCAVCIVSNALLAADPEPRSP